MKNELIISSNTSTIPIKLLTEGLSDKFKSNFLITHFFNPPRYLKLLEIVRSNELDEEILNKIKIFCDINLRKSVIETKDTPGFIGNRIGVFWIERAAAEAINYKLTVEETDAIIMNVFKAPKTGVFGLIDVVGLDLLPSVVSSLLNNLPQDDHYHAVHQTPEIFNFMLENKMIGRKGEGGFYKLINKNDKKIKYSLNLNTREYSVSVKTKIENFKLIKKDLKSYLILQDNFSKYALHILSDVLYYVLNIADKISLDIISIDEAMKNGFGWSLGPFEIIDQLGPSFLKEHFLNTNKNIPTLLDDIGGKKFYKIESNNIKYFDFITKEYNILKRSEGVLLLSDIKKKTNQLQK